MAPTVPRFRAFAEPKLSTASPCFNPARSAGPPAHHTMCAQRVSQPQARHMRPVLIQRLVPGATLLTRAMATESTVISGSALTGLAAMSTAASETGNEGLAGDLPAPADEPAPVGAGLPVPGEALADACAGFACCRCRRISKTWGISDSMRFITATWSVCKHANRCRLWRMSMMSMSSRGKPSSVSKFPWGPSSPRASLI